MAVEGLGLRGGSPWLRRLGLDQGLLPGQGGARPGGATSCKDSWVHML